MTKEEFETIKKLHDTLVHERGMIEREKFKWELGSNVIEELKAGDKILNIRKISLTTRTLFGIEVSLNEDDPDCVKLYEDITKKIGGSTLDENLKKIKEELEKNKSFQDFVKKYCRKHEVDQDTALAHAVVKGVGNAYREKRLEEESRTNS